MLIKALKNIYYKNKLNIYFFIYLATYSYFLFILIIN